MTTKYRLDMADKQVATLVKTLVKIDKLPPLLGSSWRDGMLRYYYNKLADLLVWKAEVEGAAAPEFWPLLSFLKKEVGKLVRNGS